MLAGLLFLPIFILGIWLAGKLFEKPKLSATMLVVLGVNDMIHVGLRLVLDPIRRVQTEEAEQARL